MLYSHQISRGEKRGTAAEEKLRSRYDTENTNLDRDPQVRTDTIEVSSASIGPGRAETDRLEIS